jgi:Flp pilus assembly CpaF family ATPase
MKTLIYAVLKNINAAERGVLMKRTLELAGEDPTNYAEYRTFL